MCNSVLLLRPLSLFSPIPVLPHIQNPLLPFPTQQIALLKFLDHSNVVSKAKSLHALLCARFSRPGLYIAGYYKGLSYHDTRIMGWGWFHVYVHNNYAYIHMYMLTPSILAHAVIHLNIYTCSGIIWGSGVHDFHRWGWWMSTTQSQSGTLCRSTFQGKTYSDGKLS